MTQEERGLSVSINIPMPEEAHVLRAFLRFQELTTDASCLYHAIRSYHKHAEPTPEQDRALLEEAKELLCKIAFAGEEG